jgi:hypothetical protein
MLGSHKRRPWIREHICQDLNLDCFKTGGCVDQTAGLDVSAKRKIPVTKGNQASLVHPVADHFKLINYPG